ncbi:MAG: hypothetical protein SWE60_13460 [Thermodesulfobacteriota bacterium]|nr:hypothetical protein [Thermodesulfobacteriota bacterium]
MVRSGPVVAQRLLGGSERNMIAQYSEFSSEDRLLVRLRPIQQPEADKSAGSFVRSIAADCGTIP